MKSSEDGVDFPYSVIDSDENQFENIVSVRWKRIDVEWSSGLLEWLHLPYYAAGILTGRDDPDGRD